MFDPLGKYLEWSDVSEKKQIDPLYQSSQEVNLLAATPWQ